MGHLRGYTKDGVRVTGVRIEAEGLCRRTPSGRAVLQDVSLTIQPGELVVIAGGSGAGKTTLLEALAGLAALEQGAVRFDGVDAHREAARFRAVLGYVPQDDIVHEELPLERSLRFSAALRLPGASPAEVDEAVARSMAELNLTEHAATRIAALSGGQRKRASLAVELLTGPRVFFLDEPTSGLDPATGADLLALLRRLADEGSTIVMTSHAVQDWRRVTGWCSWRRADTSSSLARLRRPWPTSAWTDSSRSISASPPSGAPRHGRRAGRTNAATPSPVPTRSRPAYPRPHDLRPARCVSGRS